MLNSHKMKNIAIFASGSGTNAENIIKHFSNKDSGRVKLVLSNRQDALVIKRAESLNVPAVVFDRSDFYLTGRVSSILFRHNIDFIVLAGFLWLVPDDIIAAYPSRIVNIHPALLPLHGGKGMYGDAVHRAVIEGGSSESGITIHYVNSNYDSGDVIFQTRCSVDPGDTPETLAKKIHQLEYKYFPVVIEDLVEKI
jgi:phosphoribosylglycinamide formyltransferase 1